MNAHPASPATDLRLGLSLVVPCYNEETILRASVTEIVKTLRFLPCPWELIFVDDHSRDHTVSIIKEMMIQHPEMRLVEHPANMGRGSTVTDGILQAQYRFTGYLDVDLEVHSRYIPSLLVELASGADVVTGHRFYKLTLRNFNRFILGRGYNLLVRKLLRLSLHDTETGCKFFRKTAILPVIANTRATHWFWDTEIMALASRAGLRIVEIPVLFIRRADKKTSVRIFKDTWDYLQMLYSFRRRYLQDD